MSSLLHYFKDCDLRQGHAGLSKLLTKMKLDPGSMKPGEFCLFVNRAQTMFKLYGPGNVLVHVKSDTGRVNLKTIAYIPQYFNGTAFNYKAALKKVIEKDLARRRV